MNDSLLDSQTAFAIVSPCSTCLNQNAEQENGKPYCPRRKAQADQKDYTSQVGTANVQLGPLALYGTEDTPNAGDGSLRNPVYTNEGKSILVWIATLRDNSGVVSPDGTLLAPTILDPSFIPKSTPYIQCRPNPYITQENEAAYFQRGGLREGDTVVATTVNRQQYYSTQNPPADSTTPSDGYSLVLIEGVVSKVNLAFNAPRIPVQKDNCPQGC